MGNLKKLALEGQRLADLAAKAENGSARALRELDEGRADLNDSALEQIAAILNSPLPMTVRAEAIAAVMRVIDHPDYEAHAEPQEPAFTVIGIYGDGPARHQRFAEVFHTDDGPRGAERLAEDWARAQLDVEGGLEIIIAGVVKGSIGMVDALEPSPTDLDCAGSARTGGLFTVALEARLPDFTMRITRRNVCAADEVDACEQVIAWAERETDIAGWSVLGQIERTLAR